MGYLFYFIGLYKYFICQATDKKFAIAQLMLHVKLMLYWNDIN